VSDAVAPPPPAVVRPRGVQALIGRLRPFVREVGKFGIVGIVGAVFDIGGFNVLHHVVGLGPLTSKAISTFVAAVVTYVGNRFWAFRHRARTGVQREFPIFVALNVVGLGIAEAVLSFTYYVLDDRGPLATNLSANVVGIGLGTLFRFWAYKRWVFRHPDSLRSAAPQDRLDDELEAIIQV
jgi:putative flippase GtrA